MTSQPRTFSGIVAPAAVLSVTLEPAAFDCVPNSALTRKIFNAHCDYPLQTGTSPNDLTSVK